MSEMEFLTPEQVAQRLQVKPRTVQEWLRTGRLTGLKLGNLWRIRAADLQAFLSSPSVTDRTIPPPLTPEERAARIRAARGCLAHIPGSVDEFCRRKQEDITWENRRWPDQRDDGTQEIPPG